jgi:hypothetical protein
VDIVKLFYEEPVYLEALSADTDPDARRWTGVDTALDGLMPAGPADPRHGRLPDREADAAHAGLPGLPPAYRLYLAGTRLSEGPGPERPASRVGVTALESPDAFAPALASLFDGRSWYGVRSGEIARLAGPPTRLRQPEGVEMLLVGDGTPDAEAVARVATSERRYAVPQLHQLLAAGFTVLFPEPAHDGNDWSVFAPRPIKDRLVEAFASHPAPGVRRFAAPYVSARGEHKFYFEQWSLDHLPEWVEEIGGQESGVRRQDSGSRE